MQQHVRIMETLENKILRKSFFSLSGNNLIVDEMGGGGNGSGQNGSSR